MQKQRTLYCNDARHWYLFVHEPPMTMEAAHSPIDEVAGTGVDTFAYGVSRDDGLFYPSKVGMRFRDDMKGRIESSAYWRVWHNMQSLIDRGLDPLRVLVDRAHERGLDFISSLRMGAHPGMPVDRSVAQGGRGMAEEDVRDFQFRLLEELAIDYPVEGIELDFAAAPGGTSWWFPLDEAESLAPVMTEFVRRVRDRTQARAGGECLVGARVYVTPELNQRAGLEIERWLEEGLVDYVLPVSYGFCILDADMPIGWLVEAATAHGVSVYPMLQPYYTDHSRPLTTREFPTAAMVRAAVANYRRMGANGFCTWAMSWPFGDVERSVLGVMADPRTAGDKHYFLRREFQEPYMKGWDYPSYLPQRIDPATDLGRVYEIPFAIADEVGTLEGGGPRVTLRLGLTDLVAADRLELKLNGESLSGERVRRGALRPIDPYSGQWLEIELVRERPLQGRNQLEVTLQSRPTDLISPLILEDVEMKVEYDVFSGGNLP